MSKTPLQQAVELVYKTAKRKQKQGAQPMFLGLDGMLALQFDNIRRYSQAPSEREVLDLAVNAVFALVKMMEGLDVEIEDDPEGTLQAKSPPEEESEDTPAISRADLFPADPNTVMLEPEGNDEDN